MAKALEEELSHKADKIKMQENMLYDEIQSKRRLEIRIADLEKNIDSSRSQGDAMKLSMK